MSASDLVDFLQRVKLLRGKPCWGIAAGEGTGSIVGIDFGGRLARARPLTNPHLTEAQRAFESELHLLVHCAWRLDSPTEVVCTWTDPNDNDGPMVNGLKKLVGLAVESVEVTKPALDLTLGFTGGLTLHVFCDQSDTDEDATNYLFASPGVAFGIGPNGALDAEGSVWGAV